MSTPSDTPRTDAAQTLVYKHHRGEPLTELCRQLERELNEAKAQLHFPSYEQYVSALKEGGQSKQLSAKLSEVTSALDAAGCPIGNEHKTYDQVERIAGLHKTRDYAWREMDNLRAENAELKKRLDIALHPGQEQ